MFVWVCKEKPCLYLELDSALQARKDVSYEKKDLWIHIDETLIKVGGEFVWLWIASEPKDKTILGIHISYEWSMLIAEHTLYIP